MKTRVDARLVTALLCLTGGSAEAQNVPAQSTSAAAPAKAPRTESVAVESIVVTASKRRELSRQVANSVTAITGATLDQRQQVDLQGIVGEVPGLSLEVDDKTAVRIVLRGLNTGSAGATAASLLDDVPTNATGAQNPASTNTPNYYAYDLQRIEVLKGPQGTLYGASAEGGIVKYVTAPPELDRYSGQLESGVDGVTSGGVGGVLKGYINIPLVRDVAAVRLDAWSDWTPGYIDDPQNGRHDTNSAQTYGWRASALVQPTSDLSIRLTAQRQTVLSDNTDYVQTVGAAINPLAPPGNQLALVDGAVNNAALLSPSHNESGVYYANITDDLHVATVTSLTSYAFGKYTSFFDETNSEAGPGFSTADYLQDYVYGMPADADERQNSNIDKFNQELRIASEPDATLFGRKLSWIVGGFFTRENSAFLQSFDGLDAADPAVVLQPALGGEAVFARLSGWAVFGSADYFVLPRLDIALGGRFEGNSQYSHALITVPGPFYGDSSFQAIRSNEHDALYSIAPRWRPTDSTTLYARIATGFRPGGPNIPVPGVTGLPASYGPDRVVNYEVGFRQDFLNRTLAVDLTGYWVDWRDVQVLSLVSTPTGAFLIDGNGGRARSRGVEWSLAWTPIHDLRIAAVGDYANATLTTDAVGLGGYAGQQLPYVPVVSAGVDVAYTRHLTDRASVSLSGAWSYTGTRYTGFSSSPGFITSHVGLPSYSTGSLRAGTTIGRYGAELYVDNISNARGLTFYGNNNGADQTGQAVLIRPRTIGVVSRVNF